MATGFRKPKGLRKVPLVWLIFTTVVLGVISFELYCIIVPFQSRNPLYHEVTIHEPVIDNWTYLGLDEEGYLKFSNGIDNVVLPPSSHMFDADGKFVVIEHYAPSTLTYADPLEAVPSKWLGVLGFVLLIGSIIGFWRFKRRPQKLRMKKIRLRGTSANQSIKGYYSKTAEVLNKPSRTKRFRAKSQHRLWKYKP